MGSSDESSKEDGKSKKSKKKKRGLFSLKFSKSEKDEDTPEKKASSKKKKPKKNTDSNGAKPNRHKPKTLKDLGPLDVETTTSEIICTLVISTLMLGLGITIICVGFFISHTFDLYAVLGPLVTILSTISLIGAIVIVFRGIARAFRKKQVGPTPQPSLADYDIFDTHNLQKGDAVRFNDKYPVQLKPVGCAVPDNALLYGGQVIGGVNGSGADAHPEPPLITYVAAHTSEGQSIFTVPLPQGQTATS